MKKKRSYLLSSKHCTIVLMFSVHIFYSFSFCILALRNYLIHLIIFQSNFSFVQTPCFILYSDLDYFRFFFSFTN